MRKLSLISIFLFCFTLLSAVGEYRNSNQDTPAYVYFFRLPNYAGSAAKMTITVNGQPIVRLRNASYFKYELRPGDYVFSTGSGESSTVRINVEPGNDYYIKCYINMGFWSGIPIVELVDRNSGKASIDGNKLTEQAFEQIEIKDRKSRAGIFLSGGAGFESYPWFTDEDGKDVKLSTGGGFGIGAEFGHQFGKNFDLSFNCFFQSSVLSERLKNASGSFNRLGLTVTPALVIPVKGGEQLRFRIGAGPGLYSIGTMKIDASEITGDILTLKYKSALGFQGSFLFESNFMERGSMTLAVRYSNIRYKYNPEGSSHLVTDPKLTEPNGSCIDFIIGYNYLF
jgi:hypothetical protein